MLVPPPPTELFLKSSKSDSEEEDLVVLKKAPKKKKPTGIIFRPVESLPPPSSSSVVSTSLVNPPPPQKPVRTKIRVSQCNSTSRPVPSLTTSSTFTPRCSVPQTQRQISPSVPPSSSIPISTSPSTSTLYGYSDFLETFKPSPLLLE